MKMLCILSTLLLCFNLSFAQVGIGTSTPDPSSILDISSTNKGLLIPRVNIADLNTAAPVINPAESLLVYSENALNNGFYYWKDNKWNPLVASGGGATGGWSLNGNTGTNATTNFLGTIDNIPLVIRTNNIPKLRITSKGQLENLNTGNSVFLGEGAGAQSYATTSNNIFIGRNADYDGSGGSNSIILGYDARVSSNYSIVFGHMADADAHNSISIGRNTQSQGQYGIVIGDEANTNSSNTVSIGRLAQSQGSGGIAIGYSTYTSGSSGIAIGYDAAAQGGSHNTSIGNSAYVFGTNSTAVGNGANVNNINNRIRLGNASITSIQGQVAFTNPSDARFKYEVTEKIPGLNFITKIKPVQYKFDREKYSIHTKQPEIAKNTNKMETGFLAQQVEEVANSLGYEFDGLHTPENENDTYSIAYSTFVVPLVKAVQEQQVQIEKQQEEIDELKKLVNQLIESQQKD